MKFGERHHTDMHCFTEGSKVVEIDGISSRVRTVVSTSGYYKDDHVQLDSKKTAWEFAGNYRHATPKQIANAK